MLIAPFFAVWMVHSIQKSKVKKEVRNIILSGPDSHELVQFELDDQNAGQFKWEHSGEFEYKGHMYDVVYKEKCGAKTVYLCWPDRADTKLNQKLAQWIARTLNKLPDHKDSQVRLQEYFKNLYFFTYEFSIQNPFAIENNLPSLVIHLICKEAPSPTTPPPDDI